MDAFHFGLAEYFKTGSFHVVDLSLGSYSTLQPTNPKIQVTDDMKICPEPLVAMNEKSATTVTLFSFTIYHH